MRYLSRLRSRSGGSPVRPLDARSQRLLDRASTQGWPLPSGDHTALTPEVLSWLTSPGPRDPSGVSRYLSELWRERADLRETFPGIPFDREQRAAFLAWAEAFALAETGADPAVVANRREAVGTGAHEPSPANATRYDVTVVGYLRAQLGLGASGRRLFRLCEIGGSSVQSIPYDHTASPLTVVWPDAALEDLVPTSITMMCVNAGELPRLSRALSSRLLGDTYRIGLWFWELETLPDWPELSEGFHLVDEIWATTEFVADAFRRRAQQLGRAIPVHVLPMGLDLSDDWSPDAASGSTSGGVEPDRVEPDRTTLGLPTGVVIGNVFDYASTIERKNPVGVINAFRRAFPEPFALGPDAGPWLVLKTHGSSEFDRSRSIVHDAVSDRPDIVILDRNFSEAEQHALYRNIDAFISLHRAEGYGLGPMEAMANAVPTIATAYSGNLSFMTDSNSWLVPWSPGAVPEDCGHYPAGVHWAEPDIDAAAAMLREVVYSRDSAPVRARAEQGRSDVAEIVSGTLASGWMQRRFAEIRASRR